MVGDGESAIDLVVEHVNGWLKRFMFEGEGECMKYSQVLNFTAPLTRGFEELFDVNALSRGKVIAHGYTPHMHMMPLRACDTFHCNCAMLIPCVYTLYPLRKWTLTKICSHSLVF